MHSPTSMSQGISGTESPTSVACTPGGWTRPAVRRDEFVIVDDHALGTLCEDVLFFSQRIDGVAVEWFRSGAELTLFQTFASQEALVAQLRDVWICGGLSLRVARSCKRVGTTVYGSDDLRVHALMGDAFTRAPHGVALEVCKPISESFRRAGTDDAFKARVEFEAIAGRDAVAAFVRDWQAAEFPHADVLEFEFFTDGRTVTLLECYESEAAHQRHFARWASSFAGRMSTILVLKDIHIYGRGLSAVPNEWEPLMSTLENPLERNHKGPVGKI